MIRHVVLLFALSEAFLLWIAAGIICLWIGVPPLLLLIAAVISLVPWIITYTIVLLSIENGW